MTTRLLALASLLLLLGPAARAGPERARRPSCTGIYTGSARGVFWCRVVAAHDPRTNRSWLRLEVEDDVQMTGDALAVTAGGFEWKGPLGPGPRRSADPNVTSAWSYVQTGLPPTPADYVAARSWPRFPAEQGQVVLELTSAEPGPVVDGNQTFAVHGSFSARLPPLPGSKAVGEVRVSVTF
jgi:hypothetical protein